MTPEQRLWQTVIVRAVLDAGWNGNERDNLGRLTHEATEKRRAHTWLSSNIEHFRMVCDLAGIDPAFLRGAYRSGRLDLEAFREPDNKRQRAIARNIAARLAAEQALSRRDKIAAE